MKKIFLALLIFNFTFNTTASALFGTRPMGMGGAFTAVADDANAAYWNPAGLALNPEVAVSVSTMTNNRNTWVGDNLAAAKFCYEAEMNPFDWIIGIGALSAVALQGAEYLSDQGVLKKGWGREGEKTGREESMSSQVTGTEEIVSLKAAAKETAKKILKGASEAGQEVVQQTGQAAKSYALWGPPVGWYHPDYGHPNYWEREDYRSKTKAQFAGGLTWLNDYNPPLDQNTNWCTLTFASGFEQRVAVGGNVNLYYLKKISTDIAGLGGDIDLGVIARPLANVSIGLAAKGLLTSDIKWQDGSITRYEMLVNGGLAFRPITPLLFSIDVHNILSQNSHSPTMHYGTEVTVFPGVIARAGLSDGSKTAGLTLALKQLTLDYAILGGMYNRTQMIGCGWRF